MFRKLSGIIYIVVVLNPLLSSTSSAQSIPQDFDFSRRINAAIDAGYLWKTHELTHPYIHRNLLGDPEFASLDQEWLLKPIIDFKGKNTPAPDAPFRTHGKAILNFESSIYDQELDSENLKTPFVWSFFLDFRFGENVYMQLYPRVTNQPTLLDHFTGKKRKVSHLSFNAFEFDRGVLGYGNEHFNIEYGRSRDIWGPMEIDNISQSGNMPAYDRLAMRFNLGKVTLHYSAGFLEGIYDSTSTEVIQRYMVSRGFTFANRKNFMIGLNETTIYAGPDRPLDLAMINPAVLHIDVDQNDRTNGESEKWANVLWTFSMDWLLWEKMRLSASLLVDEYKVDRSEYNDRKLDDQLGYKLRLAYNFKRNKNILTLIGKYQRIDTYTFRHLTGYINNVNRNEPIGTPLGSDTDYIAAGFRVILNFPVLAKVLISKTRSGENNILTDPYEPYIRPTRTSYPSGIVKENTNMEVEFLSSINKYLELSLKSSLELSSKNYSESTSFMLLTLRSYKMFDF